MPALVSVAPAHSKEEMEDHMHEIEHEAPRNDREVEITDLSPQGENHSAYAKPNRRIFKVGVTVFIVLVVILVGFTFFAPQGLSFLTQPYAAPFQAMPTATPIISPWWSEHDVGLTVTGGVAYV